MASKVSEIRLDTSGLDRLLQTEPERVETWLDGVADAIVTDIVLSYGTSPDGKSYTRGGATHVASQPGYPSNVDINALRGSIHQEKTGKLERTVSDGVEYGIYQEDGTNHIAPRPAFRPAFDRMNAKIEQDAASNLDLET